MLHNVVGIGYVFIAIIVQLLGQKGPVYVVPVVQCPPSFLTPTTPQIHAVSLIGTMFFYFKFYFTIA